MNCAQRNCVYALIGLAMCFNGFKASAKDGNTASTENSGAVVPQKDKFQWNEHKQLSWDDFKGDVNAAHNESAAATYCGIGFKTNTPVAGNKPEIVVYNTFYTKKSWVKPDARIKSILDHEQGHFDLCEIYTRRLKDGISHFDVSAPAATQALMHLYEAINKEYELRQQAYEEETTHGTNMEQQRKWQNMIAKELM